MNMKLFTIKLKSGQFKLAFTYIVIGFFHHETIHRLRQHNFGLFLTHQYVNVNTVKNTSLNVSKTDHLPDPPKQSFC